MRWVCSPTDISCAEALSQCARDQCWWDTADGAVSGAFATRRTVEAAQLLMAPRGAVNKRNTQSENVRLDTVAYLKVAVIFAGSSLESAHEKAPVLRAPGL